MTGSVTRWTAEVTTMTSISIMAEKELQWANSTGRRATSSLQFTDHHHRHHHRHHRHQQAEPTRPWRRGSLTCSCSALQNCSHVTRAPRSTQPCVQLCVWSRQSCRSTGRASARLWMCCTSAAMAACHTYRLRVQLPSLTLMAVPVDKGL